jgi:hypothetical protein
VSDARSADIAGAAAAWLRCQGAEEDPPEWVEDLTLDWTRFDEYAPMWRFVLKLCADVEDDELQVIRMIGVGPLYDMVRVWPERTLTSIEAQAETNATVVQALWSVITSDDAVRKRIDAILDRDE